MVGKRGRPPHDDILTPAEWRTVHAVRHGLSNREIARRRGISLDAVKYHVANAVGKLGLADRQALKHWKGAPRGTALIREELQMEIQHHIIGVGQISRSVRDIAVAEAWYRDTLGLDHLYTFDKLAFFDCGGTRLMLSQGEQGPGSESILYLRVDDLDAEHARLEGCGVRFINAPHRVHRHDNGDEEWMAFFEDPEGRPLALMATLEGAPG